MFPMTPLQSWALLILIFGAILILIWAIMPESEAEQDKSEESAEATEPAELDESTAVGAHTRTGPFIGKPNLRVVPDPPADAPLEEPYDWEKQGL